MVETEHITPSGDVSRRDTLKNIAFILVAVGVAYAITVSIGVDGLEELATRSGVWGVGAVILLKMTTIIFVPLSGGPIYAVAGAVFGLWHGFVITFIGDVLGFSAAFYLSRFFGRKILHVFVPNKQLPFIERLLAQGSAPKHFLKARLVFSGFPEVFAYAAGLTAVPFSVFIVAQMALHAPIAAAVVLFGDVLLTDNPVILSVGVAAAIVLAVVGGWWFKRDFVQEA